MARWYDLFAPGRCNWLIFAGHFSTLTLVFDQGASSTNLRLTWEGVPVGQEEITKRNFEDYYVRSIKTTFGYAVSFPSVSSSRASRSTKDKSKKSRAKKERKGAVVKASTWDTLEVVGSVTSVAVLLAGIAYAAVYWS